jgi:shikimate dehydrogenase
MKFAVLGFPIKHSLSPKIFEVLREHYNLNFTYEILEIKPENFLKSIDTLESFDGFNVTSPYKEKILEFCQNKSSDVEVLRAANAIKTGSKFDAFNTDLFGFKESLKTFDLKNTKALVLGSSGAAKASILGLSQLGVTEIFVKARNYSSLKTFKIPTQEYKNETPDLVVQATTIGLNALNQNLEFFNVDYSKAKICYDLNYSPKITAFMQLSRKKGIPNILNGEDMLVYQALKTFELWFGIKPDDTVKNKIKEVL